LLVLTKAILTGKNEIAKFILIFVEKELEGKEELFKKWVNYPNS